MVCLKNIDPTIDPTTDPTNTPPTLVPTATALPSANPSATADINGLAGEPGPILCLLCKQDDSQAHWLHHCQHPPSAMLRAGAFSDITEHIDASANPKYGTAFRTVLMTTTEPERIWTGNWSFSQIHHLGALLATAQVLPTSPCGLSALASEVLQLSRILSRTALQLWIVKTSIENPILRRRRIAAAEADEDRYHSTTGQAAETSPRLTSATTLDEASDTHVLSNDPPPSTTITTNLDCPQPYVNIPDTIGGNQSKRRRVGIEPSRPSPPQGVLSIPTISQAEQANNRAIITSHHRDTVVRLPNTRPAGGGEYFLSKEDLLALGTAEYAEAQCIHALSELSLSSDPTIRWIPTDFYRCLATDSIQHTGYFPGRAHKHFRAWCPPSLTQTSALPSFTYT